MIVIGSGFGGSVAAMRAVQKLYRVGVMKAGKRWTDVVAVEQQARRVLQQLAAPKQFMFPK